MIHSHLKECVKEKEEDEQKWETFTKPKLSAEWRDSGSVEKW